MRLLDWRSCLKENKVEADVIYFIDATHPQHIPVIRCSWITRGKEHPVASNTGRQLLTMNGAINVETLRDEVRFDETIDAASTIALFQQLEQANHEAPRIIVICNNARYGRSKAVAAYPTTSRIQLEPLPPYCPNLILIARFRKFFKRQMLYNRYYETFEQFRVACRPFFRGLGALAPQRRTVLTEIFQIIGKQKPKTCIA